VVLVLLTELVLMVALEVAVAGITVPLERLRKEIVVELQVLATMVEMVLPIIPQFTTVAVEVALVALELLEVPSPTVE
jgi:hypothetical protein